MYVILGATGHTGSAIAENLLAKGEKVRVIGRNKERLAKLSDQGAEALVGDAADSKIGRASCRERVYCVV